MGDPLWYKDAVIYELHVRAFADSDGDGIGDIVGLTSKLDYLVNLGVTAIWLLPFYPSPLKDDGYDIADYTAVHPAYGDIADVRQFIREAHRRSLRIITELVCNHTSDQHPWFQRARRAKPGSVYRDFYVWSATPQKYQDARIIFKDFETSNWTWDSVAGAYYWHRFYSHQPDLNFESPAVHKAISKAMEFWLAMGVDGMRLDAIPYLYEEEGTNCENLPRTHTYLKQLRRHMDEHYPGRIFLAEANQWPEDLVAYFGDGDECQMAFHFSVMPRLYMAIYQENRFPIIDIMRQTPSIPANCQWAIFLRNHDELTLEMVTDEERDYMYRVYAKDPQARINLGIRRRLAPLLNNHRRRIELMNGLLFSLPGTPVLYYGDEIGMGDNIYLGDRNGVRTPMQWTGDRNAGFSRANSQRLYLPVITDSEYHYETVNVETQTANQHSLLWWTRRLIALRKRYRAFSRGSLEFLTPANRKVLAFVRRYEDEIILVIANLSRFVQGVALDLAAFKGLMPMELFGQVEFPSISESSYFITIGPHSFYWFTLVPQHIEGVRPEGAATEPAELPLITSEATAWTTLFTNESKAKLEDVLPQYMRGRRWFDGKARTIKDVHLDDTIMVPVAGHLACLALVRVRYREGSSETYMLPLAYAEGVQAQHLLTDLWHAVVTRVRLGSVQPEPGLIYDPLVDRAFCTALLDLIIGRRRLRSEAGGELRTATTRALRGMLTPGMGLDLAILRDEQRNSSVTFGDRLVMKLFRKLDLGINPDLELSRYLTNEGSFPHTPPLVGTIEYQRPGEESMTLALLQGFVSNEGTGFALALDGLGGCFDSVLAHPDLNPPPVAATVAAILDARGSEPADPYGSFISAHLEPARLLGQRTVELHLALAASTTPAFAAEPFSLQYQRGLYQSLRSLTVETLQSLRTVLPQLPAEVHAAATQVLALEGALVARFQRISAAKIETVRIRIHGDYHLGQVLSTGNDYLIVDFEGEATRPISERQIKRSPLRDVASMLRSYQDAATTSYLNRISATTVVPAEATRIRGWANLWAFWVSTAFLHSYCEHAAGASFLPTARADLETLLDVFVLEHAVSELADVLNQPLTRLRIPLSGIIRQFAG